MQDNKNKIQLRGKKIFKIFFKIILIAILMCAVSLGTYYYSIRNFTVIQKFTTSTSQLGEEFVCDFVGYTSLFPLVDDYSGDPIGVRSSASSSSGSVSFRLVKYSDDEDAEFLEMLTDAVVREGLMDPMVLLMVENTDEVLTAYYNEDANFGNSIVHTVLINKKTNIGVWSKTNSETFLAGKVPYNSTNYLNCR